MRKNLIAFLGLSHLVGRLRQVATLLIALGACGCLPAVARADVAAGQGALVPPTASVPASQAMTGVQTGPTVFQGQPAAVSTTAAVASARKLHRPVTAAIAATTCWSWTPWEKGTNAFGGTVWQYNQGLYWCGNGSGITYRAASNDYPSALGIGWSFSGNLGYWNQGGQGYNLWTHWNQGHFCLASYFGCVQNSYPWIQSTVYGNGYGTASYG